MYVITFSSLFIIWDSIAPIPLVEASDVTTNFPVLKSGNDQIDSEISAFF